MEISQIKQQLSISEVLSRYGLKAGANGKMCCPFHEDSTASFQVYAKTNTAYCFSANCPTGGKSMDVIDFIMYKEQISKHEAIIKAAAWVGNTAIIQPKSIQLKETDPLVRVAILTKMFSYFKAAVYNSPPAKEYLKTRNLDYNKLDIGYNSGQFHHAGRSRATGSDLNGSSGNGKDEALIQSCLEVGLLSDEGLKSKTGDKAYKVFGKYGIVFPLKNKESQIVSLYFRSSVDKGHFYLKERQGLYPSYPKPETKILILTEAIIDAATLLQLSVISDQLSVLACYGVNGFTEEHREAVSQLNDLTEIIFFFDGDQAGKNGQEAIAKQLNDMGKQLTLSFVETPENEDINSLAVSHEGQEKELFSHLIENRKPFNPPAESNTLSFSVEKEKTEVEKPAQPIEKEQTPENQTEKNHSTLNIQNSTLQTSNPEKLEYQNQWLTASVWGGIETDNLSRLKVSLHIQSKENKYKNFRDDVNLYSHSSTQKLIKQLAETLELSTTTVTQTITDFTEQLEKYRLELRNEQIKALVPKGYEMTPIEVRAAQAFLKEPNLIQRTSDSIQQSGLVGEVQNGLLLFLLYLSRIMDEPLHAIIFGKSGSGKTYLQTKVSECLPEESLRTVTSLSENTLYYSPRGFWKHKVLLIEDLEGVYNAFLPLREMMSKQSISKLTTDKDAKGNNVQKVLTVEGPICVSGATTKESIYEDNANRSFLLHIDESTSHLNEVMNHQRRSASGKINKEAQEEARQLLKNAQRLLEPIIIINPYAEKLHIPDSVFKKLRTNMHYLKLIEIITFYHQYQRPIKQTAKGTKYIETNLTDIACANELIKDSLLKKSDELSGELRQFFETLKTINPQKDSAFYAKDIRKKLRMHPQKLSRFLFQLEQRSYVKRTGNNRQQGFEYQITAWEEYEQLKAGVNIIDELLEKLKTSETSPASQVHHSVFTKENVKLETLNHNTLQAK